MRRGFTLIETMTVLAIGGVMTSLAVVGLQDTVAASSETRAARSVAHLLRRARTSALSRHDRTGARLDAAQHRLVLAHCPQRYGDDRCVESAGFVVDDHAALAFRDELKGVRVSASLRDADDHIVVFNADGRPTNGARFLFDHPRTPGAVEVVVSVAGDVRVQTTAEEVVVDES